MRLIDADELNKFPIRLDHYDKEHGSEAFVFGIESVLEYAEYLPTVDAVPVTRCKDCANDGLITCPMCYIESHELIFINHDTEFFCGLGERKWE